MTPQEEAVIAAAEKLADVLDRFGDRELDDAELLAQLSAFAGLQDAVHEMRRVGRLPA